MEIWDSVNYKRMLRRFEKGFKHIEEKMNKDNPDMNYLISVHEAYTVGCAIVEISYLNDQSRCLCWYDISKSLRKSKQKLRYDLRKHKKLESIW